jgi:uncharacterized protein YndB with AHSA1/START domain
MNDTATGGETTLRLERLIPSPPEQLYALWIEPDQLAKWWAPDGYTATFETLEIRPGGRWRAILRAAGGREARQSGVFVVVEPARRLVFTWAWEAADGHETEVSVDFEPAAGGTRLVLVHRRFDSEDARDRHGRGWAAAFDRLASIAS